MLPSITIGNDYKLLCLSFASSLSLSLPAHRFGMKAHRLDIGGPCLDHSRTRLSPNARDADPKRFIASSTLISAGPRSVRCTRALKHSYELSSDLPISVRFSNYDRTVYRLSLSRSSSRTVFVLVDAFFCCFVVCAIGTQRNRSMSETSTS